MQSGEYTRYTMNTSRFSRLYTLISLNVLIAFGVFAALMLAFVKLALEVTEPQAPRFDQPILLAIHSHASPFLDQLVPILTELGGPIVVAITTITLVAIYMRRGQFLRAMIIFGGVVGGIGLNLLLKTCFERPRPMLWTRLVSEGNFSFPSGHAMTSMALAASIIAAVWYTRWRIHAIVAGAVYVVMIGLTRMYLGVHYPTDIFGGWAVGAAWVIVVVLVVRRFRRSSTVPEAATPPVRE